MLKKNYNMLLRKKVNKSKLLTKPQLVSLVVLFIVVLIGTYVLHTTYEELSNDEQEQVKEIGESFGYPNILATSIVLVIAFIAIGVILVDPFRMFGKTL